MTHHPFSPAGRKRALQQMRKKEVDMLIIGGGITGCGLARDAALRGLRVALVEKEDFAYGTSSRSSKLVHGGVRYLENGEIRMVRESARERNVLKTIAPHLVHPLPFVFPVYKGGSMTKYRSGFYLFDKLAHASKEEAHRILAPDEIREFAPFIRGPLKGGLKYGEYITEDARFTLINALSAAEHGALVANHTAADSLLMDETDRVTGAIICNKLTNKTYRVYAKITINATGPWAEQILEENGLPSPKQLMLSKGVHLVFHASKIPLDGAIALQSPDGKEGFAIRRWNYVYVGTTDVPHHGAIDSPSADQEAITHVLEMAQTCFPNSNLTEADIISTWAGLRPLIFEYGKDARDTSRHDEVWNVKEGLLTVAGGKLTTYRQMAKRIMKEVAKSLNILFDRNEPTAEVVLPGGDIGTNYATFKNDMTVMLADYGLSGEITERLIWLYGTAINDLLRYGEENSSWLEPLAVDVPAIKAEVRHAVEKEMAYSLTDFMDRRAALMIFNQKHGRPAAETAAAIMGELLGWNKEEKDQQIESYLNLVKHHETFMV